MCVVGGGHHGDVGFGEPASVLPEFSVPPVLLLLQNRDDVILREAKLGVGGSCPRAQSYGLHTHKVNMFCALCMNRLLTRCHKMI